MMTLRPAIATLLLCTLLLAGGALRADDDRRIHMYKGRVGNISAVAISNDGKVLLTGEIYGNVALWDVDKGTALRNFTGHTRQVLGCALLPDGKRGVSCADDNLVIIWELATGKRLHQMSTGDAIPYVLSTNPDGTLAATGCNDGEVIVWDLDMGKRLTTLNRRASVCSVLFSPDGKTLAAGYSDGHVTLWDTSDWAEKRTLPDADQASVGALAFTPDNKLLVTGNQNGGGFVWDVADGTLKGQFAGYANPEATPTPPVAPVFPGSSITPENRSSIVYLCTSADGERIFGSIIDSQPRFWDLKTGRFLGIADWLGDSRFYVARYGFPFTTAAVTPNRNYLVSIHDDVDQEVTQGEVWHFDFTPDPPPQ